MDQNTTFTYNYSAPENKEVQEIRKKYLPKEESKFDELRRLDHQVQTSGMIQSLTIGLTGFLLFALGVCMTAKIVGESIIIGVLLGLLGLAVMIGAYPVYRLIFGRTKEKLVPRILELAAELGGGD